MKRTIIWSAIAVIVVAVVIYLYNTVDVMEAFKKIHGN